MFVSNGIWLEIRATNPKIKIKNSPYLLDFMKMQGFSGSGTPLFLAPSS